MLFCLGAEISSPHLLNTMQSVPAVPPLHHTATSSLQMALLTHTLPANAHTSKFIQASQHFATPPR